MKDKVVSNNSQVKDKKTEVEDHHMVYSISNKTKSVTACNDSLKYRTSNINALCATCGKCLFNSNHGAYVSKFLNNVNARTKNPNIVQLILFIVDSGYTKHMTGNLKLLCNSIKKYLDTVRFGNDQFDLILGYGDLVQGNITIKKTLFLRSKDETPEVLKDFLKMIQLILQALVIFVRTDRGTEFLNKTINAYFKEEGIEHQTSTPRTPEQNDVVERQNRTLVEFARTMLSASKLPLFFWTEAIATACYTQNRSTIIPTHEKTAYHIINDRKPLTPSHLWLYLLLNQRW
nr:retrovirus-related Pol polyprotein from transposon TNT 1-94 [Tanacetum cinerariifolium]